MTIIRDALSEIPEEIAKLWITLKPAIKRLVAEHVLRGSTPRDILVVITGADTELAELFTNTSAPVVAHREGNHVIVVLGPEVAEVFLTELPVVVKVEVDRLPEHAVPILVVPEPGSPGLCSCLVIDRRELN
jgi:hypothetical protein